MNVREFEYMQYELVETGLVLVLPINMAGAVDVRIIGYHLVNRWVFSPSALAGKDKNVFLYNYLPRRRYWAGDVYQTAH